MRPADLFTDFLHREGMRKSLDLAFEAELQSTFKMAAMLLSGGDIEQHRERLADLSRQRRELVDVLNRIDRRA